MMKVEVSRTHLLAELHSRMRDCSCAWKRAMKFFRGQFFPVVGVHA